MQSSTLWTQQQTTALFYERFKIINNKRRERFRSFDNLKPSSQCAAAVNKTMSALRWFKSSFHYLDIESFRVLYKTYIRPNLEFVIQAWSPYLDKDIKIMEKIQRQATKMVPALRHLQYEDRLKKLVIYSLDARRLMGDLIETFKLLHGHTNIDYEIFFKLNNTTETRGRDWKLFKPQKVFNAE